MSPTVTTVPASVRSLDTRDRNRPPKRAGERENKRARELDRAAALAATLDALNRFGADRGAPPLSAVRLTAADLPETADNASGNGPARLKVLRRKGGIAFANEETGNQWPFAVLPIGNGWGLSRGMLGGPGGMFFASRIVATAKSSGTKDARAELLKKIPGLLQSPPVLTTAAKEAAANVAANIEGATPGKPESAFVDMNGAPLAVGDKVECRDRDAVDWDTGTAVRLVAVGESVEIFGKTAPALCPGVLVDTDRGQDGIGPQGPDGRALYSYDPRDLRKIAPAEPAPSLPELPPDRIGAPEGSTNMIDPTVQRSTGKDENGRTFEIGDRVAPNDGTNRENDERTARILGFTRDGRAVIRPEAVPEGGIVFIASARSMRLVPPGPGVPLKTPAEIDAEAFRDYDGLPPEIGAKYVRVDKADGRCNAGTLRAMLRADEIGCASAMMEAAEGEKVDDGPGRRDDFAEVYGVNISAIPARPWSVTRGSFALWRKTAG